MANNNAASIPTPSAPVWWNWCGNLVNNPAADGVNYYNTPTSLSELKAVLAEVSKINGATLRVSGQRHSQPPLVTGDNRGAIPATTTDYLVDMSCYADLGANCNQRIIAGPEKNQVTINAGVREDELDAYLTANNQMMQTVTAGGFFSLGGMTAVDVHGATLDVPIFAETVSAFNILLANGTVTTIDTNTAKVGEWAPLQFARVSLGGLGIVTSLVLNVVERPYATSLVGGVERYGIKDKAAFVQKFKSILTQHTRVETFFTPYAFDYLWLGAKNFMVLWWDVVNDPAEKTPNNTTNPPDACTLAGKNPPEYGATYLSGIAQFGATLAQESQYYDWALNPLAGPAVITASGMDVIESDGKAANLAHSDLWLNGAVAVIFMSYFIPLPAIDDAGLGKVWDSLDVVSKIVIPNGNFHIAAPMEFRFVKGGDSAMSGAYADQPDTIFVNQDLIAFVKPGLQASQYPGELLQFFADVERQWVAMGGFPHSGKMYGFYDPTSTPGTYSTLGPFNKNFLTSLGKRRGERQEAYNNYRMSLDPNGLFYNKYLKQLLG
jgi:D-arabinono-1,4-lactone oxidase/FAD binding domain